MAAVKVPLYSHASTITCSAILLAGCMILISVTKILTDAPVGASVLAFISP
jgi:hypothetical protein